MKCIYSCCVAIGLLILTATGYSQKTDPPFNVNEVIEQVSRNRSCAGPMTGEFLIDTNIAYVPASTHQCSLSVAFDGSNYLVVWQDARSGYDLDIFGTRVDPYGRVLDSAGIAISTAARDQSAPSVVFDGDYYLVVWEDWRNNARPDVYAARITKSGLVLDSSGIVVSTLARFPSIASDSATALIVWEDYRSGTSSDIYGARISKSGVVLDTTGIAISTAAMEQGNPSIASGGTDYLIVWEDSRAGSLHIYGTRVSRSGIVLDTAGIPISTVGVYQWSPSVASDGLDYMVVWFNWQYDVYGARVTRTGSVLDSIGIPISTRPGFGPAIAFDGLNYFVVWEDWREGRPTVYGSRVARSGVVLDTTGIAISLARGGKLCPHIAFDGINYFVVWVDGRSLVYYHPYGARVALSGSILDTAGIALTTTVYDQEFPALARGNAGYLVAWLDWRNAFNPCIYGARVSEAGNILDPLGIEISAEATDQTYASVAFDGSNYMVAWNDFRSGRYYGIYGARVKESGTVLDSSSIVIAAPNRNKMSPSIACDSTNYLVVWQEGRGSFWDIYGARVNKDGIVLDTLGILISSAANHQLLPSLVFGGSNYLATWEDQRNGYDVYGARISSAGNVLDPAGIPISTAAGSQRYPSAAFDGTNYMVVWDDGRTGPHHDIYGTRVSQAGTVLDLPSIRISNAPNHQFTPSVTFDGTCFLVVWQDYRNNSSWDIFGARINPAGVVVDSLAVSVQSRNQLAPAVIHGPGSQCLVIYSGWTDCINNRPANTMRIWGKFLPPVGIEEQADARYTIHDARLKITPNPFRWEAKIELGTGHGAKRMALRIYDVSGRMVRSFPLSTRYTLLATSTIAWDGSDDSGHKLPAGVYFCRLENGDRPITEKIVKVE